MASRNIQDCTSFMQQVWAVALIQWKQQYPDDPAPFLTCTYRSDAEQAQLYAQGRTAAELKAAGVNAKPRPGRKVTWAKPGQGKHNQKPSPAFDIAFLKKGSKTECDWSETPFRKFAEIVKPMRVEWGGDWPKTKYDAPHFQQK